MPQQYNPTGQFNQAQSIQSGLLTDKTIMSDCLASQKFLASCYNHAITESANDALKRDFMAIYQEEQSNLKTIFDTMARQGWYNVQYANPQDISQVQNQVRQEMAQAPQFQSSMGTHQLGAQYGTQFGAQTGMQTGAPAGTQQQFKSW